MISEQYTWSILFLPLAAFLIIALVIRPFFNARYSLFSGHITTLFVGIAFLISLWALNSTLVADTPIDWGYHTWLSISGLEIGVGVLMDTLTAVMLVVVTGISLLVQIYSQGYMRGDPGYSRYFAYMALFTGSMVGIILARSVLQLYVFWELVGLCSYLLIGFWYDRPAAVAAAKKAFLVTRIGDVGFLLSILYLFHQRHAFPEGANPFDIPDIWGVAATLPAFAVTWVAIGIFAGAVGKSGQFPLHTWLPDAMEGPTPVSALIHAATMVTAGVFLVARFFPIFEASEVALVIVSIVGGFTAIFAATLGMVMYDIKRVLAYSTISQLGYMMLALGAGAPHLAIFHLFTHAFFKALLFLGAGSVNHATGTFDMRYMGGLRRYMPWTYWTFLVGAFSLVGVFPFAGFWSKDAILVHLWRGDSEVQLILFWVALIGVFMTAFYMLRAVIMTFHGSFRGDNISVDHDVSTSDHLGQPKESPVVMVVPLVVLGVAAVGAGQLLGLKYISSHIDDVGVISQYWFGDLLHSHFSELSIAMLVASMCVAFLGIGVAILIYQNGLSFRSKTRLSFNSLGQLISNKYYIDYLYEEVVVIRVFYQIVVRFVDWVDREIIDKAVDFVGWVSRNIGRAFLPLQSGQTQVYAFVISLGILLILGGYLLAG